jgi:hypothetical protein
MKGSEANDEEKEAGALREEEESELRSWETEGAC